MPILALQGLRGGVGTTSVTAALAWALQQSGESVIAMDWSPCNQLRLHFNTPDDEPRGWMRAVLDDDDRSDVAFCYADGPCFIPFGQLKGTERAQFHQHVGTGSTRWLQRLPDLQQQFRWVLLDLPAGEGQWIADVCQQADRWIQLIVADGACHARLQQIDRDRSPLYLVNQFSANSTAQQDLHQLWVSTLRHRIPLMIHRDEAVAEALLMKQPLGEYRPHALAAEEITTLANWLIMQFKGAAL